MRVLLGVDGSQASDRAASLVAKLAWPVGSTIDVLTAHPGSPAGSRNPGMVLPTDLARERENAVEVAAQGIADDAARRFAAPDLAVETRVVRDRASKAIIDEAARFEVDLIVLGNRGHGAIESAVLGSTCIEVVDQSHRPVLVVRRDRMDRILVGEDGSKCAAAGVEFVRRWSVFHGARVRVLSVSDHDALWMPWLRGEARRESDSAAAAQAHAAREALAGATASTLRGAGMHAEALVEDGSPAHGLVEAAAEWEADLIVVGSRGETGLERLLVGSVSRAVLYHAPCSVLIVPEPQASPGGDRE
jgi:nucleotide-binding universal stress UspA family protein